MIEPKCLSTDEYYGWHGKDYGWSSQGYLLPCCWHDERIEYRNEIDYLFNEKLHISNVKNIEEILNSNEWKYFYENMDKNTCCNFYCGKKSKMYKICERKL